MNFLTAVKNHRERERSVGLRVTGSEIGRMASDARRGEYLMTKAVQIITLYQSLQIPFDKLMLRQFNVRCIKAGVSVEDLAEDITRRGPCWLTLGPRPASSRSQPGAAGS